ncbi:MAG: hypothetical protein J0L70_18250 [Leptolyngbya sp. UWPOB_LEPTO1]|uniref:hypothetical protein n=1 Tax=Leptolyngbya sp. UWPOB_LEPTO1 TaxID=2815653 RepID=UPI001ACB99E9|nr:hypothetical protein [Leptolyngbya sp. UWPOB_LEPTO1]MBN8562477.1 hypothetical protein [Leptolyngbya sp. UWPOB_LEPTO1]
MALDKFNPQLMHDDQLLPATLLEMGDTLNFIETRKHTLRNEIKTSKIDAGVGKVSGLAGIAGGGALLILSNPLGSLIVAGGAVAYSMAVFAQWLQTGKVQIMPLSSKTQAERDVELSSSTETGNAYDIAAIQGQRDSIREDAAYLSDREKVEYELLHFSPEGLLSAMNHVHPTQRWACYQFLIDAFLAGTIQSYFANPQALRDVLGNPAIYTSHLPEASKRFPEYGLQGTGAIRAEDAIASFQPAAVPTIGSNTRLNAVEVSATSAQPFTIPIVSPESKLFDWNLLNTAYDDFPHLLMLGKTGAGKSFLAEYLGRFLNGSTIVITPKKKPKDFIGMQVIGVPYDFATIAANIGGLSKLVKDREAEMNQTGKEDFLPINVILDEVPTFVAGCNDLKLDVVKDLKFVIRAGRTSKVRLILLAQGQEVKTLGIEGEGSLRDNLSYVYLKGFAEKQAQDLKLDISTYDRPCIIDSKIAKIAALLELANQKLSEKPPIASTPEALDRMYRMESEEPKALDHEVEESVRETDSVLPKIQAAFPQWKPKSIEVASTIVDWLAARSDKSFAPYEIRKSIRRLKDDSSLPTEKIKTVLDVLVTAQFLIESEGKYSITPNAPNTEDYDF